MYGWRKRIGLMVPSSNTTMESEFHKNLPDGVSVHTSRMKIVDTTAEALDKMNQDVARCADLLKTVEPDVIVFGCTTGSLLKGKGYDVELIEQIQSIAGVPAVATAPSMVEAMKSKGMKKLAVATPYIDDLNDKEVVYLHDYGFEVEIIRGLSIVKNTGIGACEPSVGYRLAREVFAEKPNVDGVFISCTNFRTVEILEPLSRDIGKPVVSSNQASLWMALKTLGVSWNCWGLEA